MAMMNFPSGGSTQVNALRYVVETSGDIRVQGVRSTGKSRSAWLHHHGIPLLLDETVSLSHALRHRLLFFVPYLIQNTFLNSVSSGPEHWKRLFLIYGSAGEKSLKQ